jgi:branched-chain amino acid transport system ATP-binding protein
MLEVRGLDAGYGLTAVLKNVSLAVPDRAVVALLGGNGAGKTTTLNTISGFLHPTAGTITLDGQSIAGLPSHEIVRRGVVQVPQGREVFPGLTVHENLELGAIVRRDVEVRADLEMVYALFPRLRDRRWQKAGSFSGGEQQMLAIGRGMMARPRVLLLDEPSMGLAPLLVEELGGDDRRSEPEGHDHPTRGAEHRHGTGHRRSRLHPQERRHRGVGRRQ